MKFASENIKNYLKYAQHVLGVSHIFQSNNRSAEIIPSDANRKKKFSFYFWPTQNTWAEYMTKSPQPAETFQTLFVFFSSQNDYLTHLQRQTEMIAKMNQALGGTDRQLLIACLSPNAERDLFSTLALWPSALKVVLFRDETNVQETIYSSGIHSILETLTPINNPNDQTRKRHVWNDFKRWMSSLSG